jgi:predicted RNA-binding Zn-ribbon protein involved in translation (DUF1610 family)
MKGYCLICKKLTEIVSPRSVKLPNAKNVVKGTCPDCGTEIWKKEP